MKRTFTVQTRVDKNGPAKATVLTMDFEGCTVTDLIGPAEDSLVIVQQGRWRRAKNIPAQHTIKVKDMIASMGRREGVQITVDGLAAAANTMSQADRDALLKKLQELNAKDQAQQPTQPESKKGGQQ